MSDSPTPAVTHPAQTESAGALQGAHAGPHRSGLAWFSVGAHIRFWFLVVAGLTLDLWSKEWALHTLGQGPGRVVIPYVLDFQTMFNPGALFGIGHGNTELFLVASVVALALVLAMFARSGRRQWLMHIALGAICAGALGNMYDRAFVRLVAWRVPDGDSLVVRKFEKSKDAATGEIILREYPPTDLSRVIRLPAAAESQIPPEYGYVRDFIKINSTICGQEIWPWVFNVADMLLVGGVGILALKLAFEKRPKPEEIAAADAAA